MMSQSLYVLLIILNNCGYCFIAPEVYRNSCSNMIQLQINMNQQKFVLVTAPRTPHQGSIELVIVCVVVNSRLSKIENGTLKLYRSRSETIERIKNTLPIQYIVTFPKQSPTPLVKSIIMNKHLICTSSVPSVPGNMFITEIRFHHILHTGLKETVTPSIDQMPDTLQHIPQSTKRQNFECGMALPQYSKFPALQGGLTIQKGSWPWLVAVYIIQVTGISYNCGATLVSRKSIVSAAHCFQTSEHRHRSPDEVLLSLGRHDVTNWTENGSELRETSHIFIHPDYRKTGLISVDADIAVIWLKASIEFSEFIRPICLSLLNDDLKTDESEGVVVGWGSDGNDQTVTQTPRCISLPIVSEAECLRSSNTFHGITSNRTFCAGRKDGYGPCHGDSGSGMAVLVQARWTLIGIVSAALAGPADICDLSNYVVFTDVTKYRQWIISIM